MKFKISELLDAEQALRKLDNTPLINVKATYRVGRDLRKVLVEIKNFNETRNKLIEKYADRDEKGKIRLDKGSIFTIKEEHKEEWKSDIDKLMQEEVDLDIHPIPLDWIEPARLTPNELMSIEKIISDETTSNQKGKQ